jgi:hypothetical protein
VTTSGQHREVGAFRTDQRRGVGFTQAICRGDETTGNQDVKRILGVDGTFWRGAWMGNDWAANVIKAVGNTARFLSATSARARH